MATFRPKIRFLLCLSLFFIAASPEPLFAFKFKPPKVSLPNLGDILPDLSIPDPGDIFREGERLFNKGREELRNAIRDSANEAAKLVKKTFEEVENAKDDLEILVREGRCGGDICDAVDAIVRFTEATVVTTGHSVENAAKRFEEGKPIDALWHFSTEPLDNWQKNAAEATARSSVIRAVGQVAAGAYGGPQGAAAYAAWLTYNATDGDLELALRAGAIAGATAWATSAVSSQVEGVDIIETMTIDEIAQKAVMLGAISGTAVALSGGSQSDIEQAVTAGVVMSVIRDGYKELTLEDLDEDTLKASNGEPYCKNVSPSSLDPCAPEPEAYLPNDDGGEVQFDNNGRPIRGTYKLDNDGNPVLDMTKMESRRPHVGKFGDSLGEDWTTFRETTGPMQFLSKIPGFNAMAFGHDIFDMETNNIENVVLQNIVRIGTIAPSIVLTYEGAGYKVHELIRQEVAERRQRPNLERMEGGEEVIDIEVEPIQPNDNAIVEKGLNASTGRPAGSAAEIRNLICRDGDEFSNTLMEIQLDVDRNTINAGRICSIDQIVGREWVNIWHAHYQRHYCIERFNELAARYVKQGQTCYFSLGLRNGDDLDALKN